MSSKVLDETLVQSPGRRLPYLSVQLHTQGSTRPGEDLTLTLSDLGSSLDKIINDTLVPVVRIMGFTPTHTEKSPGNHLLRPPSWFRFCVTSTQVSSYPNKTQTPSLVPVPSRRWTHVWKEEFYRESLCDPTVLAYGLRVLKMFP